MSRLLARIAPCFKDASSGTGPDVFSGIEPEMKPSAPSDPAGDPDKKSAPHNAAQEKPSAENFPPGPPPKSDWTACSSDGKPARPPIAIKSLGTVNHEKIDPFATAEARKKRLSSIMDRAEKNRQVLEDALFILSQSDTGRALLQDVASAGYKIVFDDKRTGDRGAAGLCDSSDMTIVLRGQDDPEYLALLLGHECTHAVQNTKHDLFPSSLHKPEVAIMLSFAIEADAYAQQTQIALELANGSGAGPADQVRYKGPLLQMRLRFPGTVEAAEKVMLTPGALSSGATVAAAFCAFYDNFRLRSYYEDSHMEWVEEIAPQLKKDFGARRHFFDRDVDVAALKHKIQHRGLPYLEMHLPNFSFLDARHAGVTEFTAQKIEKFYDNELSRLKKPALKIFGLHFSDSDAEEGGITAKIRRIFNRRSGGKKPPANHNRPNLPRPPKAA